jgi:Icc-related predicted phosphoesterase
MAGDIFSATFIRPWRQDAEARKARKRAEKFVTTQLKKYELVLYVMGNHEHYGEYVEDSAVRLELFLENYAHNTRLLDNKLIEIEGVVFMGTTLWAKSGFDTAEEWRINNAMRDFSRIRTRQPPLMPHALWKEGGERAFQPSDAARLHAEAKQWLIDSTPADKPVVLITHHAPSFQSGHGVEYGAAYMDDAYCGNIVDIILERPNIKLAVHGHTHDPEHYRLGQTLVISNPRGYFPEERRSRHFDARAEDIDLEELKGDRYP